MIKILLNLSSDFLYIFIFFYFLYRTNGYKNIWIIFLSITEIFSLYVQFSVPWEVWDITSIYVPSYIRKCVLRFYFLIKPVNNHNLSTCRIGLGSNYAEPSSLRNFLHRAVNHRHKSRHETFQLLAARAGYVRAVNPHRAIFFRVKLSGYPGSCRFPGPEPEPSPAITSARWRSHVSQVWRMRSTSQSAYLCDGNCEGGNARHVCMPGNFLCHGLHRISKAPTANLFRSRVPSNGSRFSRGAGEIARFARNGADSARNKFLFLP